MGKFGHGNYRRVTRLVPAQDLKNHVVHKWEFVDKAEREAATGFTADDQYHVARDVNTNNFYVLVNHLTREWVLLNLVREWYTDSTQLPCNMAHSSRLFSGQEGYRCFDGNTGTYWLHSAKSSNPYQWVRFDLVDQQMQILGGAFNTDSPGGGMCRVRILRFQGSHDGTNFTTIGTVSSPSNANHGMNRAEWAGNGQWYRFLRVYITHNWAASRGLLREVEFYGMLRPLE